MIQECVNIAKRNGPGKPVLVIRQQAARFVPSRSQCGCSGRLVKPVWEVHPVRLDRPDLLSVPSYGAAFADGVQGEQRREGGLKASLGVAIRVLPRFDAIEEVADMVDRPGLERAVLFMPGSSPPRNGASSSAPARPSGRMGCRSQVFRLTCRTPSSP